MNILRLQGSIYRNSKSKRLYPFLCTLVLSQTILIPAYGFDAGSAWGTTGTVANSFAQSSATHANNGTAAVYAEQGRGAQLPGSSITTIGVFNQLSVIGDGNSLSTDQTGTNSGDVTSDTDLTYQEHIDLLDQTLFLQP